MDIIIILIPIYAILILSIMILLLLMIQSKNLSSNNKEKNKLYSPFPLYKSSMPREEFTYKENDKDSVKVLRLKAEILKLENTLMHYKTSAGCNDK